MGLPESKVQAAAILFGTQYIPTFWATSRFPMNYILPQVHNKGNMETPALASRPLLPKHLSHRISLANQSSWLELRAFPKTSGFQDSPFWLVGAC